MSVEKMPGHWVLARVGKRVLRPGGRMLTERMLGGLGIRADDEVVEFAPGLGVTARRVLAGSPRGYTGVERDESAAVEVRRWLRGTSQRCVVGSAMHTGLADGHGTVVYGEAMLTMHTQAQKQAILREAFRVLRPGGRYGIHEMSLEPGDLGEEERGAIQRDLSAAIRVGARPLTRGEWRELLEQSGFEVSLVAEAPMSLLEPGRLLEDEGVLGVARIVSRLALDAGARARVLGMREAFRRHRHRIGAVALVARKPAG